VPAFDGLRAPRNDAVVAVTSDHGEAFWEHGLLGHGTSMHAEMLHVPFLLRAHGRIQPGTRVAALAQTVDVGPTLLEAAGLAVPDEGSVRGRSLWSRVLGMGPALEERWVLSEAPVRGPQTRALTTTRLKVIRSGGGTLAYSRLADPDEARPLTLAELPGSARLDALLSQIDVMHTPARPARPDLPDTLRALGYVFEGAGGAREPPRRP
jgi:arylsulfatase A-like enzyme